VPLALRLIEGLGRIYGDLKNLVSVRRIGKRALSLLMFPVVVRAFLRRGVKVLNLGRRCAGPMQVGLLQWPPLSTALESSRDLNPDWMELQRLCFCLQKRLPVRTTAYSQVS
jgi:hypothetical protein